MLGQDSNLPDNEGSHVSLPIVRIAAFSSKLCHIHIQSILDESFFDPF